MLAQSTECSWQQVYRSSLQCLNDFKKLGINWHQLYQFSEIETLENVGETYPINIPVRVAQKIIREQKNGPLFTQFMPQAVELSNQQGHEDPIGDHFNLKSTGLIHRYHNRVLFSPQPRCPINCRYCFRKNELPTDSNYIGSLTGLIEYLKCNPQVNEVILTGGDPLLLSNNKIADIFTGLAPITTVESVRFHTRFPVSLPERIDREFLALLSNFKNRFSILMAIHYNHPHEMDELSARKILNLSQTITLLSQSVLLRGVNDNLPTLKELYLQINELNIRPYYLHHPDQVKGGMHFYLEKKEGKELMQKLRRELSGWMLPHYILDDPAGKSKVSL